VRSMTGYGRSAVAAGEARVEVVVQGWNQRHLDLVFRLPESLRSGEAALRERVRARVTRGRCEVGVRISSAEGAGGRRELDVSGVRRFSPPPAICSKRASSNPDGIWASSHALPFVIERIAGSGIGRGALG
jgi:uncharacterized protein YicC (UPF0701 family)